MRDENGNWLDYAEVKNDYLDETDGFWRIDAWETGDYDEEGKVVAYVHDASGDAVITEPLARLSEKVKEAIEDKQREIRAKSVKTVPDDYVCVHIAIEGRYDAYVPRGTVDEMKEAGIQEYYGADFGELHDVDCKGVVYIEDADGKYLYEC